MVDVPFDEPTIAFSQENMARQFGVLHKDGRKVYPDDDTPILVTKEWLKVAVHTYMKAREIE
jgi:hypothetical protein